jgi:hypothetical protein
MQDFKRKLHLVGLVLIMLLATVGISLGGGIPIPMSGKKEDGPPIKIELVKEDEEDDTEEEASVFS